MNLKLFNKIHLNFYFVFLVSIFLITFLSCSKKMKLSVVNRPDMSMTNNHYVGNQPPLAPLAFIKLPVSSIKPNGWLKEYLIRQKNGLTGNLGKISAWLQKEDNAWLSDKGEGKWGWEELPYWLKGYANIGYILRDKDIIKESSEWLEGVINSQRSDGNFGPNRWFGGDGEKQNFWGSAAIKKSPVDFGPVNNTKKQDFWGNMIMLYCLQSYYEYTKDERVLNLMTKYFKYQLNVSDKYFLKSYWQERRAGDNLYSVIWLYNRTKQPFLLKLAEKLNRNTADWTARDIPLEKIKNWYSVRGDQKKVPDWYRNRIKKNWDSVKDNKKVPDWYRNEIKKNWDGVKDNRKVPDWYRDQIDWHNVNHAQCFRQPAQYYQISKDSTHLKATYENFNIIREHFGQVPGGMFGADENARPGYFDPRQAVETCGMVEQMNSDQHLLRITGDPFWADHNENVAFNSYPAAVMPDFKSLHYLTAPNMVLLDSENHRPGIQNHGPMLVMNPLSHRCCQHNHTQGWPYFVENLWMATNDNGIAALVYSASEVDVKVGKKGREIKIIQSTNYPFEDKVVFKVNTSSSVEFPFYLRIPSWCDNASIHINGKELKGDFASNKYVKIEKLWNNNDEVVLKLPMKFRVKVWKKNYNSFSVSHGPLTYSLKIDEKLIKRDSEKTAIWDAKWRKDVDTKQWSSWEIHPASDWNYSLIYDKNNIQKSFEIHKRPWPKNNFPFTIKDCPIVIKSKAKKIPEWKLDKYKLVGELKDLPNKSDSPIEYVELVPMGAARLRISSFPNIE